MMSCHSLDSSPRINFVNLVVFQSRVSQTVALKVYNMSERIPWVMPVQELVSSLTTQVHRAPVEMMK